MTRSIAIHLPLPRLSGSWLRRLGSWLRSFGWLLAGLLLLNGCGDLNFDRSGPVAQEPQVSQPQVPQTPVPVEPTQVTPIGQNVRVALLLPLSGPQAPLGQAMLNAAQMALEDRKSNSDTGSTGSAPPQPSDSAIALLPFDTAGTGGAAAAAQQAIANGASIILGPVFANDARAVAPVAKAANIRVISFSTDRTVAGGGVYVMGLLPATQVARGLTYASAQGFRRVAVLAPANIYGQAIEQAVRAVAARSNIAITTIRLFDPESRDPAADIKALNQGGSFDALLLADGGQRLRIFSSLLEPFDIDPRKIKLVGTALWDDPSLGQESALINGWYVAPQPQAWLAFADRYQSLFGAAPPRLSTLSYDAVSLVAVLSRSTSGAITDQDITAPAGFAGIDGVFRFLPDGSVERGLAILRVTPEGPQIQDPAPQSFDEVQN